MKKREIELSKEYKYKTIEIKLHDIVIGYLEIDKFNKKLTAYLNNNVDINLEERDEIQES